MSKLTIPLYHGTDKKLLSLTKEQRDSLKKSAFTVIHYYYKLYNEKSFELHTVAPWENQKMDNNRKNQQKKLGEYYHTTWDAYTVACLLNKPNYQYDAFYLTGDYDKACRYARHSTYFGEIGYVVFRLWNGANLLGYKTDNLLIQEELKNLQNIWNQKGEPVLIRFDNIEQEFLLTEKCNEIENWDNMESLLAGLSFRLKYDICSLSDYEIIQVSPINSQGF